MGRYKTTKEERAIIDRIDNDQIERWAGCKEFWRIYRAVIKATKDHFNVNSKRSFKECVIRLNCKHGKNTL